MSTVHSTIMEFNQARDIIEKKVEEHLKMIKKSQFEIPKCILGKDEFIFSFNVESISKESLFDILKILEVHFEEIRTSGIKDDYIIIQDRGSINNPYKSILEGIRFKLIRVLSVQKVEISKRTNITQNEIEACINVFKYFFPNQQMKDPKIQLQKLGATIYTNNPEINLILDNRNETKASHRKYSIRDIVGYKKVHEQVFETIILPLKHPEVFQQVAQATRGTFAKNMAKAVLFQGPAGVGKTSMARIISDETEIPLIYIPIENILSKYYGESSQNLASVFDSAALLDKAIIFIDEIDSLATSREQGLFEATRRMLSVLLRKIDGLESKEGILTIGSTNRTQDLDKALLSRFDTIIHFNLPDKNERILIFKNYARHLETQDLEKLTQNSEGLSGRDIEDVCEYAERRWSRKIIAEQKQISPPPFEMYFEANQLLRNQKD